METPIAINLDPKPRQLIKHYSNTGVYLQIPEYYSETTPIIIDFTKQAALEDHRLFAPKNHILVEKYSNAQVIEIYNNTQSGPWQTKAQTTIELQEHASLAYILLQQAHSNDQLNITITVTQASNSNFQTQLFSYGGNNNQITLHTNLTGNNTACSIHALTYGKQQEQHDLTLQIKHDSANSRSNLNIRSLVDHYATCSLDGNIYVAANTAKTTANMQHKTLLLADTATINSKPQLEIYNDEVVCSHGSSIGQLDANALLYMNCRGIPTNLAKQLLLQSFIAPIINNVANLEFKQQLQTLFCPELIL